MRVSKLLQELKISYKRLIRYNTFLDTPITSPNQELEENTYLQIIVLLKNKEVDKQLDNIAVNEQISDYNGYVTGDLCKFIGTINWYFDKAKQAEYGFAKHNKLGDIHFRGNVVKGINPHRLIANDLVIFSITRLSFIYKNGMQAVSLYPLDFETDIVFLIYFGIIKEQTQFLNQALTIINKDGFKLDNSSKLEIENIFNKYFNSLKLSANQVIDIINIAYKLNIVISEKQIEIINTVLDAKQKFQLFIETNYLLPFQEIETALVAYICENPLKSSAVLNKLDTPDLKIVLEQVFNLIQLNPEKENLQDVLQVLKSYNYNIDYSSLSPEQVTKLWIKNSFDVFPIDAVYKYLFQLKSQKDKTINTVLFDSINEKIYQIFNKATIQEYKNLFSKVHYQLESIDTVALLNKLTFFIDYAKEEALKQSFFETINNKATDFIKLQLFLSNYTNEIDYNNAVIYTGILSTSDQKYFFKKVLMLIETKVLNLNLEDLNRINSFNYTENEYAKEIDGVGLDFTLSIILKIASDLSNNEITSRNTIFDIIANQIKSPKDLLVIDGFFSECDGRTLADSFTKKVDEKLVTSYFEKKTNLMPRFKTFCDGRKAIDKKTGQPLLSTIEQMEFWWCENTPCFESCRNPVNSENWRDYTLQDVLRILNIKYSEVQYEITLSVINRVNRFLEHLNCENCNSILRPNGRSNYGFYGVSMFSCTNKECEKPDKDVYLSHCLNGQCEDYIDSRESVKCKPSSIENPENCGWYICNNCYACCDSEKLNARKHRMEGVGQNYLCHTNGHRNLGIICCHKCGTETNEKRVNAELYTRQLDWFISMVDSQTIEQSGQRKDGKWWFRWYRGNLTYEQFHNALVSLKNNGFQVPNIDSGDDIQFVAEPLSDNDVFKCSNCENIIDLSDTELYDYSRVKAIKHFHSTIYPVKQ